MNSPTARPDKSFSKAENRQQYIAALLLVLNFCSTSAYNAASAQTESNTVGDFTAAVQAYGEKRYAQALTGLAGYLRRNPKDADANYYLASTYMALGKRAEAQRQYEYILSAFPTSSAAQYSRQALAALKSSSSTGIPERSANSSNSNAAAKATASGASTKTPGDPDEERIPLHRGTGGHLMMQIAVNGKSTEFAFDTGASLTCITKSCWQRLGNPVPTEVPTDSVGGVGGVVGRWTRDAEIQVGGFKRKLPMSIIETMPFDGLLGQDFFQDLQYNLSNSADYVHIFAKGSKTASRSIPYNTIDIPFTKLGNDLLVMAKVNDSQVPMIFDTGASDVVIGAGTAAMLGIRPTGEYMVGSMSGVGEASQCIVFNVDSVSLGGVIKRNVRVIVGGSGVCLLGQSFLKDFRYVIDNDKSVIHFLR